MSRPDDQRPVIGLTASMEQTSYRAWSRTCSVTPKSYIDLVRSVQAIPVILPIAPGDARQLLDRLDGLLLTGGPDIDPATYGEDKHQEVSEIQNARDHYEFELFEAAHARGLPVLGICRGAQLMNVARGGSLHQHLPDLIGTRLHQPGPNIYGPIDVLVQRSPKDTDGSATTISVHCHHHQAIKALGRDIEVIARAQDGIVEAIRLRGESYAIGIQWHPEQSRAGINIIREFVDAANPNIVRG